MKFEFFIASGINKKNGRSLSDTFLNIAVIATALSIIVMILSLGILAGFKKNIKTKLSVFSGHIIIMKHDLNYSYEKSPITENSELINQLKNIKAVRQVQVFAIKPGLIKTEQTTQGVVLKGIDENFDWKLFEKNIIKGEKLDFPKDKTAKQILISEKLADLLGFKINDKVYMYFLDNPPKIRKYTIKGIFSTGLPEFDKIYILTDIRDVRKLNDWKDKQITGYEVILDDYDNLQDAYLQIFRRYGYQFDSQGNKLDIQKITQIYPQIFSWLSILDLNAIILIVIVFTIAAINIITALLIMILDKSRMIGILKALGASNANIRKIFIINGLQILLKGMLWGNLIALGFSYLQMKFHIIPLNAENYYISYVPISLDVFSVILLNLGVAIATFFVLLLPTMIVGRISPAKVIKFN